LFTDKVNTYFFDFFLSRETTDYADSSDEERLAALIGIAWGVPSLSSFSGNNAVKFLKKIRQLQVSPYPLAGSLMRRLCTKHQL
jgi:hypothetical protein